MCSHFFQSNVTKDYWSQRKHNCTPLLSQTSTSRIKLFLACMMSLLVHVFCTGAATTTSVLCRRHLRALWVRTFSVWVCKLNVNYHDKISQVKFIWTCKEIKRHSNVHNRFHNNKNVDAHYVWVVAIMWSSLTSHISKDNIILLTIYWCRNVVVIQLAVSSNPMMSFPMY